MAGLIGSGVTIQGLVDQDAMWTWNVSGTIDKSTDLGKAVSIDATANNTVKLCADDAVILGVLASYEDRTNQEGIKIGTVSHKGGFKVPYVNGATALVPIVGHSVKGSATPGKVKPVAAYAGPNIVTAVDTANGYLTLVIL